MVSKVFEHPFDLTKVRLQSQVLDVTARFNGPVDCLGQTWKKEGVRGLYRVRNFFFGSWLLHNWRICIVYVVGSSGTCCWCYARECDCVLVIRGNSEYNSSYIPSITSRETSFTPFDTCSCWSRSYHQFSPVSLIYHFSSNCIFFIYTQSVLHSAAELQLSLSNAKCKFKCL